MAGFELNPSKTVLITNVQEDAIVMEGKKLIWVKEAIFIGKLISIDRPTSGILLRYPL